MNKQGFSVQKVLILKVQKRITFFNSYFLLSMLALTVILGMISIIIGWYGNLCVFWEINYSFNAPSAWKNSIFRTCHFILSVSITGAFAYSGTLFCSQTYDLSEFQKVIFFWVSVFFDGWYLELLLKLPKILFYNESGIMKFLEAKNILMTSKLLI